MRPEENVKIGLMPPLSGLVGIYGSEIVHAGQIACQEINDNGGVLGRPLELIVEDDGSMPETAVVAARKLLDEHHCTAIIGNLLSNSRIAVAYRVAEPRRVPYLNFSFYEGSILSRYFFHFAALPNQQIEKMIPYMYNKFGPRMFFAGNNYEWPRGSIHAGKLALEQAGGKVVGEEYCPIGVDEEIIDRLLDKLEAAKPDVFVPYFAGSDQVLLLTRFTERGLKTRIAVVMGHYDEMMASQLPPEVRDGFYSSNTYFMSIDSDQNKNYLSRLAQLPDVNGIWPRGNGILTNFGEGTYVCVKAFAEAANQAGTLDPEALVDALRSVSVNAPQGKVTMLSGHHHARINTFLTQCNSAGEFTIVESFGAIEPVLPDRYNHQRIGHQATLEDDIRLQARMLEQLTEAVLLIGIEDSVILYANAGAERMFGYNKGELVGLPMTSLNGPSISIPQKNTNEIASILNQKGDWEGEIQNIKKDGTQLTCSANVTTFTHPVHGEVWLAVHRDITERRKTENALAESEARYRRAEQGTNDGLWEWNIATGDDYFSPRWLALLGYKPGELPYHVDSFIDLIHPDDKQVVQAALENHFENNVPYSVETRLRHKNGEYKWVNSRGQAERDSQGDPVLMSGFITDVTERKHAEKQLAQHQNNLEKLVAERTRALHETQDELVRKERLAALGQLTATVSHELRNPLGAIRPSLFVIGKKTEGINDEKLIDAIARIERSVTRCDHIIDELLDFTRITHLDTAPIELDAWLSELINEQTLPRQIQLTTEYGLANTVVMLDPSRFRRAFINVFENASQALLKSGSSNDFIEDASLAVKTYMDADRITVCITDNGYGIADDVMQHIFEPLFSTKGFGVGLGMPTVKQIMEQHKGGIDIVSEPGKGTAISLWLPRSAEYKVTAT